MSHTIKYSASIAAVFIWIGFLGAISFMEAWLKFQAPGITLPLGLGIGRLVFGALNKVELVLSIIITLNIVFSGGNLFNRKFWLFLLPFSLLIIQTIWLLPALDARAELHLQGAEVSPSNLHFYYVGIEFIKVISLSIFGITLFKLYKN